MIHTHRAYASETARQDSPGRPVPIDYAVMSGPERREAIVRMVAAEYGVPPSLAWGAIRLAILETARLWPVTGATVARRIVSRATFRDAYVDHAAVRAAACAAASLIERAIASPEALFN